MSDLPTPVTREEQYLNGIAQGDTSNLPTPVGREEKYLDYIARNGGGGGGGTTNYNALDNKPQIAGTTLQGNKTLADLGIASAEALGNKVDKEAGKGLSTNDYSDTEKAEVAKVAGKADKTATASGEALALAPTSEGKALIHTAYGMSVQDGTPTPSSPVDIESAKVNFISTDGDNTQNVTTNITLRAIEVSSTDDYNLVRDNKYYIADTLDYSEDNGYVVTRRIQEVTLDISTFTWSGGNTFIYLSNTGFMGALDDDKAPIICNYLPTEDRNNLRNDVKTGIGCRIGGPNTLIINILTYTSQEDYITWASGKTIKVVGALATPTTETITTEQALALLSLKTYDESTSISSQAEPSCTVAIEYAKERLAALTLIAHNTAKGNDLRISELEETP